jgi:AbrB family looped-hinge helix DNA binding protein
MKTATRVTMDRLGRIVLPKKLREEAGIEPGMPLDMRIDDGRIEIEPASLEVRIVKKGPVAVAIPEEPRPRLRHEVVRHTREALRARKI